VATQPCHWLKHLEVELVPRVLISSLQTLMLDWIWPEREEAPCESWVWTSDRHSEVRTELQEPLSFSACAVLMVRPAGAMTQPV
jgi:hypothetical protein